MPNSSSSFGSREAVVLSEEKTKIIKILSLLELLSSSIFKSYKKSSTMEHFIAVQFTAFVCFSSYISGQLYEPLGPVVLEEKLKISLEQLHIQCEKREILEEILAADYFGVKFAHMLARGLVKEAKKHEKINDEVWEELRDSRLRENPDVFELWNGIAYTINKCLDDKQKLKKKENADLVATFTEAYSLAVITLAKKKFEMDYLTTD